MTFSELLGSAGVLLVLVAFVANLAGVMSRDAVPYLLLNLVGGALACVASALIGFLPFVVLEGVWTVAAAVGLVRLRAAQPAN